MIRRAILALAAGVLLSGSAAAYWHSVAQVSTASAVAYSGPGDVVASASAFWGLRAYTAAYATGLGKLANVCTALDAVCADVSSDANGNFNISAVGSLACNNTVSICTIKTLYDQIGTGCGGSNCDVTQATIANRPTLVVAGAANGCPSTSLPCMNFAGASSQCLAGTNSYTQAQPFSISLVGQRPTPGSIAVSVGFLSTRYVGWAVSANTVNSKWASASPITTASASDAAYHSLQFIISSSIGSISVDGATTAGNSGTGTPATAPVIGAGSTNCVTTPLSGFIAEAGIWPIGFSAGNISGLNSNAHSYWGF